MFSIAALRGGGVTAFVDADAARAAPRATCSIFPARPRSREIHARTLSHGCDGSPDDDLWGDECGTAKTAASIFFSEEEGVERGDGGFGAERAAHQILGI